MGSTQGKVILKDNNHCLTEENNKLTTYYWNTQLLSSTIKIPIIVKCIDYIKESKLPKYYVEGKLLAYNNSCSYPCEILSSNFKPNQIVKFQKHSQVIFPHNVIQYDIIYDNQLNGFTKTYYILRMSARPPIFNSNIYSTPVNPNLDTIYISGDPYFKTDDKKEYNNDDNKIDNLLTLVNDEHNVIHCKQEDIQVFNNVSILLPEKCIIRYYFDKCASRYFRSKFKTLNIINNLYIYVYEMSPLLLPLSLRKVISKKRYVNDDISIIWCLIKHSLRFLNDPIKYNHKNSKCPDGHIMIGKKLYPINKNNIYCKSVLCNNYYCGFGTECHIYFTIPAEFINNNSVAETDLILIDYNDSFIKDINI